jgi:hypothetical protein
MQLQHSHDGMISTGGMTKSATTSDLDPNTGLTASATNLNLSLAEVAAQLSDNAKDQLGLLSQLAELDEAEIRKGMIVEAEKAAATAHTQAAAEILNLTSLLVESDETELRQAPAIPAEGLLINASLGLDEEHVFLPGLAEIGAAPTVLLSAITPSSTDIVGGKRKLPSNSSQGNTLDHIRPLFGQQNGGAHIHKRVLESSAWSCSFCLNTHERSLPWNACCKQCSKCRRCGLEHSTKTKMIICPSCERGCFNYTGGRTACDECQRQTLGCYGTTAKRL